MSNQSADRMFKPFLESSATEPPMDLNRIRSNKAGPQPSPAGPTANILRCR